MRGNIIMAVEYFFSDMDNTLLTSNGSITQENIEIIKKIDTPFSLVSARAPIEMDFALDLLDLKGPQVGFNGGIVFQGTGNTRNVIEKKIINFQLAKLIVESIVARFPDVSTSFYDENFWYTNEINKGIAYESSLTKQSPIVKPLSQLFEKNIDIYKIMIIIFDESVMTKAINYFTEAKFESISVQRSGKNYLEITHEDAIKENGIKCILQNKNINLENTYAFGDGHNDIPMFNIVGHAVAMANSALEVKQYADYLTDTNDNSGVGKFILKLLKNNPS